MQRWATIPIACFFLLLFIPLSAHGQGVTTATIRGTVEDAAGEPLPGANVVAVHQPSGTQYGTSTSTNGQYTLPNLRVGGPYIVTASFVGYQSKRETGIRLNLGETSRLSFSLAEKTAELDEVEVVAERGAIFDKERTGIATNISEDEIDAAPTLDRSIADFTRFTPQAYVENDDDDGSAISIAGQNNRYNSIFIDGAVSNDVFGLAATGTDGGQSGATPISIGAIEQFQVDISPFDVTQSFFGGGAINAVTKSGTNEFTGSFTYERRSEDLGGVGLAEDLPGGDPFPEFSDDRYIVNVGGPIIQDKLFFFANADIRRNSSPQPFEGGFSDYRGSELSSASDVQAFESFVQQTLNFNPGAFSGNSSQIDSDKFFGKLDWNVSQNHRLSARYDSASTENVDAFGSDSRTLAYSSRFEVFPNTTQIAALEWNGTFGNRYANKAVLSYKNVEDDRDTNINGFFPTIDIDDGAATVELGPEPFSTVNFLEQDVVTFTNNFNVFLGDHTLTVGTHNEWYDLGNLFIPFNNGWYFYDSVDDFRQSACAATENPADIEGCQPFDADPDAAGYQRPNPSDVFLLRGFSLVDDNPNTPGFEESLGDNSNAFGQFNSIILGFYVQDEWQVNDRLRVTGGLRVDIPKILDDPRFATLADDNIAGFFNAGELSQAERRALENEINPRRSTIPAVEQYYDLNGAAPGEVPDAVFHWAPRLGFNYDAFGDQRTQIRGGVGVYTSRQPFVWPGGMFLNNGVRSGEVSNFGPNPLVPDASQGGLTVATVPGSDRTEADLIPSGRLEMFEEDYKLPRFLRYSLGIDQQLPGGFIGTLEGQYTNTLQNILVTNVNLLPANETLDGPDERPIWIASDYDNSSVGPNSSDQFIDSRYSNIHRVGNTDRGYAYDVTARLRNTFERVLGLDNAVGMDVSYTYGRSFVVNDGTSSQINSLWDGVEHVNGANNVGLSESDFSIGHRVLARFNYRQQFGNNLAARLSLVYTGESGRPFSYVIGNSDDMVGENGDPNSLFYVPRTATELSFSEVTIDEATISPAQQAAAVDEFIAQSDYLSRLRGEYADRNGDRTPWEGVLDLNLAVEVFGDLVGSRQQKLEITANIFNFSSLLGDLFGTDWGERYIGSSQFELTDFEAFADEDGGDYTPIYSAEPIVDVVDTNGDGEADQFNGAISEDEFFDRVLTGSTYSSLWQLRLGVRLTF